MTTAKQWRAVADAAIAHKTAGWSNADQAMGIVDPVVPGSAPPEPSTDSPAAAKLYAAIVRAARAAFPKVDDDAMAVARFVRTRPGRLAYAAYRQVKQEGDVVSTKAQPLDLTLSSDPTLVSRSQAFDDYLGEARRSFPEHGDDAAMALLFATPRGVELYRRYRDARPDEPVTKYEPDSRPTTAALSAHYEMLVRQRMEKFGKSYDVNEREVRISDEGVRILKAFRHALEVEQRDASRKVAVG